MKKSFKGFTAGVLIGAMLTGGTVFAKTGTETIEAFYNNIKIYVDGVKIDAKDATGEKVEPFIYNGTTYLPVRAVGEAIGKTVTWDGETQSVYLGPKPGEIQYLMDVCPPYDGNYATNDFKMAGKRCTGFRIVRGDYALINLNGKYSSLEMTIGPVDGWCDILDTAEIRIVLDKKVIKTFDVETTDYPIKVSVPLKGALQMKIEVEGDYNTTCIGFDNIIVK